MPVIEITVNPQGEIQLETRGLLARKRPAPSKPPSASCRLTSGHPNSSKLFRPPIRCRSSRTPISEARLTRSAELVMR